ncbi:hypothetical protein [Bradyrhizobium liaoningense]|uniref:hypothetical protein n=1 Tax=Bradyrhizobium liaoningense TaxID=43992 RepID=UPI001BA9E4F9|nr:hypothetical protein [Bradyrhizobium liaoningense]MBR0986090.1 hypothetical protein [Bradyrhizobium liaoningense]
MSIDIADWSMLPISYSIASKMFNRGADPVLMGTNREILELFIYEQWRRVPDIHDQVLSHDTFRLRVETAIADFEQTSGPLSSVEKDELIHNLNSPELRKQIPGRALRKSSGEVLKIFQDKALVFVEAPNGMEFVVGSSNVVKTSDRSSDLRDSSVEIWLPFAPRFAAVLVGRELPARIVGSAGQINSIDQALARKSSIIASRNVDLIRTLRPGSKIAES